MFKRVRVLTPTNLLCAICTESTKGTTSYNDLASQLESEEGISVTKQAVWKKVKEPCMKFFIQILEHTIARKVNSDEIGQLRKSGNYKRILVQDSTIIKLPCRLFEIFSGVSNGHSKVCNARIQGIYDILAEQFITFSIDPYSKNDLKAAPEIILQEGDLVLRDRGYLIMDEIQRHIDYCAHCIYRYKYGMIILDPKTKKIINILKLLKTETKLDMEVMLNNKEKTIVRLVANPVNQEIANNRRVKAKKEKKAPPSKEYLQLLSWSIFITTIPQCQADPTKLFMIYSLRWRIEIIFKSWKSNIGFDKIHNVSYIQLHVLLLARFIMILIFFQNIFQKCKAILKKYTGKFLSLLKLTHYLQRNPSKIPILLNEINNNEGEITKSISALKRYCSYENRRNKTNYEQQMDMAFA